MNRPSRTDEPQPGDGYNQNPPQFSNDLTTNQDLKGISNTRMLRREEHPAMLDSGPSGSDPHVAGVPEGQDKAGAAAAVGIHASASSSFYEAPHVAFLEPRLSGRHEEHAAPGAGDTPPPPRPWLSRVKHAIVTFGKFVGPGFMVAVAYSRSRRHPDMRRMATEI